MLTSFHNLVAILQAYPIGSLLTGVKYVYKKDYIIYIEILIYFLFFTFSHWNNEWNYNNKSVYMVKSYCKENGQTSSCVYQKIGWLDGGWHVFAEVMADDGTGKLRGRKGHCYSKRFIVIPILYISETVGTSIMTVRHKYFC